MKKYKITTEISPIKIEINCEATYKSWEELEKQMQFKPIDSFRSQPTLPNYLTQIISEETFKVLDNLCNIEMDKYGEKTYVCNNIRMKIEEVRD